MLIIIDNYDSFTYNLVHYFGELGAKCEVHRNDKIIPNEIFRKNPQGIILSPGPCTPNEAGICLELIDKVSKVEKKIPVLGVCLGHQAIGQAFGGKIIRAPLPMHGKLSTIKHTNKSVFKGLPPNFKVTRYHSLIIEKSSLPDVLEITAETEDGIIMGVQHKVFPIHGVQFHPESIASDYGYDVLANFMKIAGIPVKSKVTLTS